MRFLIVGASGFIGGHLHRQLEQSGHQVLGTCHQSRGTEHIVFDQARDRLTERLPAPFLAQRSEPCWVVHATGFGSPDAFVHQREAIRSVHVEGTQRLVADLASYPVRHVYLSSSYVFDGVVGRYGEPDPCQPICEYGRQKVEVEQWLLRHAPGSIILRLDKVIGDDPAERHLLSEWLQRLRQSQPILCLRDQTMAPVLVTDIVQALQRVCSEGREGVFHVAGPERLERLAMARQFQQAVGLPGEIVTVESLPFADPRPLHSDLDASRLRQAGFHPEPFSRVVQRLVAAIRPAPRPGGC